MQRVLIVDDVEENLYLLEVLLKGNGFEVTSAVNGAQALEFARQAPPDLVVSDILMPVMDGYALCREWRADERLKAIPFIFYTATFTGKKDEELALGMGADRFLIKPMEPALLMACIRETMAGHPNGREAVGRNEAGLDKQYNEALFRKLEKKMADLEQANRELHQRMEEQQRLEGQLRQAQKMEAVGRFSAGIAHDFNNILTVILGYGGILRMSKDIGEGVREKLEVILAAGERARSLADSLLTFSRKTTPKLQNQDFNRTLKGVEVFLRRVIGEDVTLSISTTSQPLMILADKGHIEQVLMNLAANARDAMPDGGTLSIETSEIEIDEAYTRLHGVGAPGRYALLSVTDTGVGMDAATCQQIFEPFFTTKESCSGTGLGLSIVYGIVKQHNGHIRVLSEPGRGTVFHVLFPLVETVPLAASPESSQALPPGGSETILVVDNEAAIREYLDLFLSGMGYKVYLAVDGIDVVRKFREKKDEIDLVVMDMVMPKKSGRDAAVAIRNIKTDAKILFITGYAQDACSDLAMAEAAMITKPSTPTELALKVREVLDHDIS
ncbi:response regulator [Geomonas sp. Red32]|uniref:response regulator n=1 Tax=Geomonas sp. Red32 TaxID=2912856 RepID=UPI00202CD81A|nr:response regulator [Geomonas sp. Red32]MCM0080546.1 response regulator [Geomonas sp. Red32]